MQKTASKSQRLSRADTKDKLFRLIKSQKAIAQAHVPALIGCSWGYCKELVGELIADGLVVLRYENQRNVLYLASYLAEVRDRQSKMAVFKPLHPCRNYQVPVAEVGRYRDLQRPIPEVYRVDLEGADAE